MEIGSHFWSIKSDLAADLFSTQRVEHILVIEMSMYVWEKGE